MLYSATATLRNRIYGLGGHGWIAHIGQIVAVTVCRLERRPPIPTVTPLRRFLRFAMMGLIGVPINLLLLAGFLHLLGERLYPLALVLAFEISTTINFVLNQLYTYGEQRHMRVWEWVGRALKAQATTISAQAITLAFTMVLKYEGVNTYLASLIGMACAFLYNFVMSNRFVFLPKSSSKQVEETALRIKVKQ